MEAVLDPDKVLSMIMDGMAQSHSELPYLAGKAEFPKKLKCHLQGSIIHGKGFTVYRTFHNVKPGSNLAIYVWLAQLEALMKDNGDKLPDTVCVQIDGGAENANVALLGIAELLVAKKLCKKVVITRLPPGPTHEDIDAMFGVIWNKFRSESILTPQAMTEYFNAAFKRYEETNKISTKIIDIFAVPDYKKWIEGHMNPLSRMFKEEWAQLQIIMDESPVTSETPNGVRTSYRAYASNEVIELFSTSQIQLTDEHRVA